MHRVLGEAGPLAGTGAEIDRVGTSRSGPVAALGGPRPQFLPGIGKAIDAVVSGPVMSSSGSAPAIRTRLELSIPR